MLLQGGFLVCSVKVVDECGLARASVADDDGNVFLAGKLCSLEAQADAVRYRLHRLFGLQPFFARQFINQGLGSLLLFSFLRDPFLLSFFRYPLLLGRIGHIKFDLASYHGWIISSNYSYVS